MRTRARSANARVAVVPRCGAIDDDEKEVGGNGRHGGGRGRHGAFKWKCGAQGSTRSAWLRLCRQLPLSPLPLLALEGRTLLMRFTRPVTPARRQLLWLEERRAV